MKINMFHLSFQVAEVVIRSMITPMKSIQLFQYLILTKLDMINICDNFIAIFILVVANYVDIELDVL